LIILEGEKVIKPRFYDDFLGALEKRLDNLTFDEKIEYLEDLEINNVIKFEVI
jgi:hypothetical protein